MPTNSGTSGTGKQIQLAYPEAFSDPDQLLAAYFSSPTVGLGILDSELRYLAINNKLAEINGTPAPAHLGKTVRQIMGDHADLIEPEFRSVLSTGEPATFEVSAVLPTRPEIGRWIIHCFPIRNVPDLVTRIGAMVIDIVDWKKSEHSDGSTTRTAKSEIDRLQLLSDVGSLLSSNWNIKIFSKVSARIHRVLQQEYTAFSLRDENTGLLVRQAEDFRPGRGRTSAFRIRSTTSPSSRALKERSPWILSQGQLESFSRLTPRSRESIWLRDSNPSAASRFCAPTVHLAC